MTEVRDHFAVLESDLTVIDQEAGLVLPLAPHLGWLPRIGDEARAAPQLLELARSAASAGRATMDGALPVLEAYKQADDGSALERVVPALQQAGPHWQEAEAALDRVAAARANLDLSTLDPRVANQIERLDQYLPLLRAGVSLAQVAPALLGAEGSRTYLLLAQNSDELRPTGGFITGVGLVDVNRGKLGEMDFQDSYAVYTDTVDHPLAPPDLERYMGAQILLFRDANWTPDYPTAAAVAQSLFNLNTEKMTDGAIAFDLEAARRIVAALEPLDLPGYDEPVTGSNLTTALRDVWAAPVTTQGTVLQQGQSDWWLHRKDFMGDLAGAVRAKVESGQADFGKLAQAIYGALEEKHVLISLNDPAAMELLAEVGWVGAIEPGDGDYLMVVDSNVGWNKANAAVDRQTAYRVTPAADGTIEAQLELTYTHKGQSNNEPCVHVTAPYGESYQDLVDRCYFDYVRVYVPEGARLLSAEGFEPDTTEDQPGEPGTSILSGFMVIPPGETHQLRLTYELPADTIREDTYRLLVQKQPGTPAWPITVTIVDSSGSWQPISPAGVGQSTADGAKFSWDLRKDTEIVARRF